MTSHVKAGSNLPLEIKTLEPVETTQTGGGKSLGAGSFTAVYLWRGNGTVNLPLGHPAIKPGSRITASASEYNTAWNVDRFIGAAAIQVLNVSPYNGGVYVKLNCAWGGPINNCITLIVDP